MLEFSANWDWLYLEDNHYHGLLLMIPCCLRVKVHYYVGYPEVHLTLADNLASQADLPARS